MTQRHNQDYLVCETCRVYQFPTSIESSVDPIVPSGRTIEFQCPSCAVDLEVGILHDMIDVCFCNQCRGYVIDSPSFHPLVHELRSHYSGEADQPSPLDPKELDRVVQCPTCLDSMQTHPYYGPGAVVINSCSGCKINWMNHGELALIMRAPGKRPKPDESPFTLPPVKIDTTDPVYELFSDNVALQTLRIFTGFGP
ncbi:MAG: hypothetical protein AAFN77_13995 [Planctomycetota bacterium]